MSSLWVPTLPAATDALLAAWRASADLSAADIRDGPEVNSSSATQAVICGWNGIEGDETAADGQEVMEGLAGNPDRESYAIRCAVLATATLSSKAGAVKVARDRACALYAACGAAVKADPKLGGAVMRAAIGPFSLRYKPDQAGLTAFAEFSVTVDAYTGRM